MPYGYIIYIWLKINSIYKASDATHNGFFVLVYGDHVIRNVALTYTETPGYHAIRNVINIT